MGYKRDLFIVRLKNAYSEDTISNKEDFNKIPEKFRQLFSSLWNHHQSIITIAAESTNFIDFSRTLNQEELEQFYGLYRNTDCLQQVIREVFFDTVLIIQNVYSPFRINLLEVVQKEQIVTVTVSNKAGNDPQDEVTVFDRMIAKAYAEDLLSSDEWNAERETLEERFARKPIVNMREDGIDPVQDPR